MTITQEDHLLAADIATQTGELLVSVRAELETQNLDTKTFKDKGDSAAHDLIMELLTQHRPDDAILSEEGANDLARLASQRTWIVDPLDGTREYSEPPRSDWAVHIALVTNNQPVVGAVALPALGKTLSTAQPAPLTDAPEIPRVIVSRTRRPAPAVALADALGAEYIEMGSAGAKAMAVVKGEADIYAHAGGQYEWDSCAPAAVALAAGLHCSRLDGSPLIYNKEESPYLPDLLICHPTWADKSLQILSELAI